MEDRIWCLSEFRLSEPIAVPPYNGWLPPDHLLLTKHSSTMPCLSFPFCAGPLKELHTIQKVWDKSSPTEVLLYLSSNKLKIKSLLPRLHLGHALLLKGLSCSALWASGEDSRPVFTFFLLQPLAVTKTPDSPRVRSPLIFFPGARFSLSPGIRSP